MPKTASFHRCGLRDHSKRILSSQILQTSTMAVNKNLHSFKLADLGVSFPFIHSKPTAFSSIKLPKQNPKNPQIFCLQTTAISPTISTIEDPFTVDYLVQSCGLSLDAAISASHKINLQTSEKPDSVLALLRNLGFSKTQISTIIKKRPFILLANPNNTLLPKLEFFYSIGVSKSELARTLSSDPTVLTRSLEKQIIPSYNFLKSVLLSNEKIVSSLKRTTWIFLEDYTKNLAPNIELLRGIGVPHSCISLLLAHFPEAMMQKQEKFSKIMREVLDMGFDPKKSTFVLAIHAISGKGNKSIWNKCFEVYKRWGWSKEEIHGAFRKHPHCMILSEKKIMASMEFLVNQMGLPSKSIAHCPVVLFFSLEKRIVPRCRVIKVLLSKGLIKDEWSLPTVLFPVEKRFLERFVARFEDQVPELLSVYEGKIDFECKDS